MNKPRATPKRVLLLARYLDAGGITSHLAALAEGLQQRGIEVVLASRGRVENHPRDAHWFEARGIPHISIPFPLRGVSQESLRDAVHALPAFLQAIRAFRPDLIHVHFRSVSLYAGLARWIWRIPCVATLHAERIAASPLRRLLSYWGDAAIGVSHGACAFLQQHFCLPKHRIHYIPSGIDAMFFRPPTVEEKKAAKQHFQIPPETPVVAMVANLYPNKRHADLLQALAALSRRGVKPLVLFAGSGDATPFQQLADTLGITKQVRFLGHTAVRPVLWGADVFVLPSHAEGFPVSVIEAMACGVVPIRTDAGGADAQIEQGVTGFLTPFNNPQVLADTLERLLANAPLRQQMGEAARKKALDAFSADQMVGRTLALYEAVLGARTLG